MTLEELIRFTGLFFKTEGIDYFIFGATAMNFWMPPRNTVDLDAVVSVDKRKAVSLMGKLRRQKIPFTRHLAQKFLEGRLVKVPLGDTDLDLKLAKTRHEQGALTRAKTFRGDEFELRVAVPEDLVLFKLQYWRKQDQADIEQMIKQRKDLDVKYVEGWLERIEEDTGYPLRARWQEVRAWFSW